MAFPSEVLRGISSGKWCWVQQLNPAQRADTDSDGSLRKRPATQCFGAEMWLHFKLEMGQSVVHSQAQ